MRIAPLIRTLIHTCVLLEQVSGHVDVGFSSASVIINLQTWVLLLDYLGIGIPTPPPSPSSLLEMEEEVDETQQQQQQRSQVQQSKQQTNQSPQQHHHEASTTGSDLMVSRSAPGSLLLSQLNRSLNQDALDFGSLPGPPGNLAPTQSEPLRRSRPTSFTSVTPEGNTYSSSWVNPLVSPCDSTSWTLPQTLNKVHDPLTGSEGDSVWGTEGKMSVNLSLNVHSLTVTFNKPEHPLATGVVSTLAAEVEVSRGNFKLSGSLGQASVVDLTETGAYYRERWVWWVWSVGGCVQQEWCRVWGVKVHNCDF